MASRRDDFLGRGWDFPPTFTVAGGVRMVEGLSDVQQSLRILLSTTIGERLLHPTFGSDLRRFVFEPLSASIEARIRDLVETAILYFEPRVVLEAVHVHAEPAEGRLELHVSYAVPATNTRANMVLPYALGEGASAE